MHRAAEKGFLKIVEILLSKGAELYIRNKVSRYNNVISLGYRYIEGFYCACSTTYNENLTFALHCTHLYKITTLIRCPESLKQMQ